MVDIREETSALLEGRALEYEAKSRAYVEDAQKRTRLANVMLEKAMYLRRVVRAVQGGAGETVSQTVERTANE